MSKYLIKSAQVVNEGVIKTLDVLIEGERIAKIAPSISCSKEDVHTLEAEGLYLLPGLIDDQVHFREPGLEKKGTISSESKAAVAGGITSYMDMPNTVPSATDSETLEKKYAIAAQTSLANFSFFFGINKYNLDSALKIDNSKICGLSDDGLYFDDEEGILANYPDFLDQLFSRSNSLIALHCEDDKLIKQNLDLYLAEYGEAIPMHCHPLIRSEAACLMATKRVIALAKKHQTRLHILHVTTAAETNLFSVASNLREKKITGEACVHHLWFTDQDYVHLGSLIKWNPAIKSIQDKQGLLSALLDNRLDIIATDHAPHLFHEKEGNYLATKSGAPLVQHALPLLLELYHQQLISLEQLVARTSHHVADIYRLVDRGYIREGYYADLTLVDLHEQWRATNDNTLYKCAWSPFENFTFKSKVQSTFVSGHLAYHKGKFNELKKGKRLIFEKDRQ